jgi:phospholipid/cholesterol/gamma-HCH transport system permease protein
MSYSISSRSTPSGVPASAVLEANGEECIIRVRGHWLLNTPVPSWYTTIKNTTATSIKILAHDLEEWDTALILFLIHGRTWCLEKNKKLEIRELPANIQRILSHTEADPHPKALGQRPSSFDLRFIIGSKTLEFFSGIQETLEFLGNCTLGIFQMIRGCHKFRWKECFLEMQHCWSSSLPIVSFISFLVGVILAFQAALQLQRYGAGIFVVDLVSLSIVREMGPIMAAIIVAGSTGAGFAAQLGNMKVDEEIDALQTLGISEINFLVLPRLLAVTIMMPILAIYADVLGILGGMYISASMLHIPATIYIHEMQNRLSFTDVSSGIIKSFFFGIIIALAGCLRGIHCERNTAGVGHATSSAVVTGIMLIILADAIFSVIYNTLGV